MGVLCVSVAQLPLSYPHPNLPPKRGKESFCVEREAMKLTPDKKLNVREVLQDKDIFPHEREDCIQDTVNKMIYRQTRRRPMVFAVVNEV